MMRLNNVKIIIGASTVALIALIFFQVRWLIQAKDLIETNFEQKVRMALCYAVENMETDGRAYKYGSPLSASVCSSSQNNQTNALSIIEILNEQGEENQILKQALSAALTFYGIDMEYEMNVWDIGMAGHNFLGCGNDKAYCCPLSPFPIGNKNESSLMLNVQFPNKTRYVLGQMGFMLISSILILLFISIVFILANYTLIRQKRISELNVDFFNNMAHEFRTPLTNISLANKLLVKNRQDLKDNRYLEVVKRENNKLLQQIERVLYLAKLENGDYQLQKTSIQLDDLIREVVSDMDMQIKEREAHIEVQMGENESWQIVGDRLHLGNVFRNLIDNALKYSDMGTSVWIRLQKKENGVVISFKDNGMGIAKSEQVYIFNKFSRIANQNIHNQKGFGLGLSYVKMIVERHNGFVEVMSDLQKGCRFDLFFPA
ncbi:MAG: HAMP domain-containing sensor histidine kinase [Chitinophagales bacterium]